MKKDLLDVLKGLCTLQNNIREVFDGDFELLGREISDLSEIIMVQHGIEVENELVFEQLMNFGDGDITKKKLLEKYLTS